MFNLNNNNIKRSISDWNKLSFVNAENLIHSGVSTSRLWLWECVLTGCSDCYILFFFFVTFYSLIVPRCFHFHLAFPSFSIYLHPWKWEFQFSLRYRLRFTTLPFPAPSPPPTPFYLKYGCHQSLYPEWTVLIHLSTLKSFYYLITYFEKPWTYKSFSTK